MITQKKVYNLTFTKFEGVNLPDFVKDIVEVKGHSSETSFRLYPRNTPEILINLSKPIRGEIGNKILNVKRCTIQGSKTNFVNVWHPSNCHFMSIRFTTNGYYKFLEESQNNFTDQYFDLEDIINQEIGYLFSSLQDASLSTNRFRILINWLKKRGSRRESSKKLLSDYIIEEFSKNPVQSVKLLVKKTGYTRKHLAERFKEEAGLTIKEYQRINRIYWILKEVNKTERISWARLSNRYGFYDQSHFIKEFKRLTGFTPSDYLRQISRKSLAS